MSLCMCGMCPILLHMLNRDGDVIRTMRQLESMSWQTIDAVVDGITGSHPMLRARGSTESGKLFRAEVRKTPCRPRSWANLSRLSPHSHRRARAALHRLGRPDAPPPRPGRRSHGTSARSGPGEQQLGGPRGALLEPPGPLLEPPGPLSYAPPYRLYGVF
jgi:hypothetical protein